MLRADTDGRLRCMTAVYISRGEEMLLLYRVGSRVVAPSYCGVGGHFEPAELNDARACVLRELREETGLLESDLIGLSMRYCCLRLKNGEVRQNYYFFGRLTGERELQSTEGEPRFFTWDVLKTIDMPVSARHMMDHYLKVGRFDENRYAGITEPEGSRFVKLQHFE